MSTEYQYGGGGVDRSAVGAMLLLNHAVSVNQMRGLVEKSGKHLPESERERLRDADKALMDAAKLLAEIARPYAVDDGSGYTRHFAELLNKPRQPPQD